MSIEEEHYSRRDIGELPVERDPERELQRHILRDGLLGDHEKPERMESILAKTPDELRESATRYDAFADEILEHGGNSNVGIYDQNREYARILLDLAEQREQGPEPELDAQDALTQARANYQELLKESSKYQGFIDSELNKTFSSMGAPELIAMKINEHEENASIPAILVSLLEKYPGLKEAQKLGSLARNRLRAFEKVRQEARDAGLRKPLGDHRDEIRKKRIAECKEIETLALAEYRVYKTAANALKQALA